MSLQISFPELRQLSWNIWPSVTIDSDKISQQGVEQCYITMVKFMTLRETSNLDQPRSQ